MKLDSGHEVEHLVGKEDERMKSLFSCHMAGTIQLQPQGWILTKSFLDFANKIYNFKFRSTDILIMTFPKSGTSWTQELVWTMINNPDLNNPAASTAVNFRSPFLEYDFILENPCTKDIYKNLEENPRYQRFRKLCPQGKVEDGMFLQMTDAAESPRIIKTHLALSFFNKDLLNTCKVIYVTRNPKDVCISFCHHMRIIKILDFRGTFHEFVESFVNDKVLYGPYWKHIEEIWKQRSHPNLHVLSYEKMTANIRKEMSDLMQFLNIKLTSEQLEAVIDHSSFSTMKNREGTSTGGSKGLNMNVIEKDGGFFRKGASGDWKTVLTPEETKLLDSWTAINTKRMNIDPNWMSI